MRDIFNSPTLEDAEAMLKRKTFTETNQVYAFPPILKPHHQVVGVAHHHYGTTRHFPPPGVYPQVEHIMQVDVRDQG